MTLPEQGGFNERLDEALALIKYSVEYRETHGGCPPEVSAIKRHGVAEAKAVIRTLVLEELEDKAEWLLEDMGENTFKHVEAVPLSAIKELGGTHDTK